MQLMRNFRLSSGFLRVYIVVVNSAIPNWALSNGASFLWPDECTCTLTYTHTALDGEGVGCVGSIVLMRDAENTNVLQEKRTRPSAFPFILECVLRIRLNLLLSSYIFNLKIINGYLSNTHHRRVRGMRLTLITCRFTWFEFNSNAAAINIHMYRVYHTHP